MWECNECNEREQEKRRANQVFTGARAFKLSTAEAVRRQRERVRNGRQRLSAEAK
jgi:hypothetical protein